MRARPLAANDPSADIVGVRTPQGEELYMDRAKKLEQGCTVAVFLDGHFVLVGRLVRRPTANRLSSSAAAMAAAVKASRASSA